MKLRRYLSIFIFILFFSILNTGEVHAEVKLDKKANPAGGTDYIIYYDGNGSNVIDRSLSDRIREDVTCYDHCFLYDFPLNVKVLAGVKFPEDSSKFFRVGGGYKAQEKEVNIFFDPGVDTGDVKNMSEMFFGVSGKIEGLEYFDTSNVTNMSKMFYTVSKADPNVKYWDTSRVTDMSGMFAYTDNANPDVSKWDISNVTTMGSMFEEAKYANPNTSKWNTGNVTNMSRMFDGAINANPDVSKWDTGKVTTMEWMFAGADNASPNISKWNTGKVTNISHMFFSADKANPDVSKWDVSNVTEMDYTFASCPIANPDVSKWNTSKLTSMEGIFLDNPVAKPNVSNWDTSNVYNINRVFENAISAEPDVSKWNTSKVATMADIFKGAINANPNMSQWDLSNLGNDPNYFLYYVLDSFNNSNIESIDTRNWVLFNKKEPLAYEFSDMVKDAMRLREFIIPEIDGNFNLENTLVEPERKDYSLDEKNPEYKDIAFVREIGEKEPHLFQKEQVQPSQTRADKIAKYYVPQIIKWEDKLKYFSDIKFKEGDCGTFTEKVPRYQALTKLEDKIKELDKRETAITGKKVDTTQRRGQLKYNFQEIMSYKDGILGKTRAEDQLENVLKIPKTKINQNAQEMAHVGWIDSESPYEAGKRKTTDSKQILYNLDLKDYKKDVTKDITFTAYYKIKATLEDKSDDIDYIKIIFDANGGKHKRGEKEIPVWVLKDYAEFKDAKKLIEDPKKENAKFLHWSETQGGGQVADNRPFTSDTDNKKFYANYETENENEGGIYFGDLQISQKAHRKYIFGYEDQSFGPKKSITRAEVAQILYQALKLDGTPEQKEDPKYTDIKKDAWYYKAVKTTSGAGVFEGYEDNTFRPEGEITRAELIGTIKRFERLKDKEGNTMKVPEKHWAKKEIEAASQEGWLDLYKRGKKEFNIDQAITREEVVTILNKAFGRTTDKDYIEKNIKSMENFKDINKEMWSYYEIINAANTYLGDGTWKNHAIEDKGGDLKDIKWDKGNSSNISQAKFRR